MSTTFSTVHLPAVSRLWPRARRLLLLAFVAVAGAALTTATAAPHALATGVVHVQRWMADLTPVQVFLGLVGLLVISIGVAIATAIEVENNRELFDVR